MSFKNLKRNKYNLDKLNKAAEETNKAGKDERFWTPSRDKAGNGYAVFRFLPEPSGREYPWAKYFDHAFQGPTGLWFFENCPTTHGRDFPCPVCEENGKLWNSGSESNKKIASKRKRQLHYVANIYMINDKANPENNGKVFLFKFGAQIFNILRNAMAPEYEDEEAFIPFDFWEGANFKLKIRDQGGFPNYEKSEFESVGPLFEDDEAMEEVYNKLYNIDEFDDPDNFKSYDVLKDKLNKVLVKKASDDNDIDLDEDENESYLGEEDESDLDKDTDFLNNLGNDDDESDDDDEFAKLFNEIAEKE